jgi:hypothetical protein
MLPIYKDEYLKDMLTQVPFKNIEIVGVLGSGRSGTCFKVKWNGMDYAMKQFDIGRCGDEFFCREIDAYIILKEAWGGLVPQPIFISESYSGGILFLGLQLGRGLSDSELDSDNYKSQQKEIFQRLETEYGIKHNDVDGRNVIMIPDSNGKERMVAIDFEDWDKVE